MFHFEEAVTIQIEINKVLILEYSHGRNYDDEYLECIFRKPCNIQIFKSDFRDYRAVTTT